MIVFYTAGDPRDSRESGVVDAHATEDDATKAAQQWAQDWANGDDGSTGPYEIEVYRVTAVGTPVDIVVRCLTHGWKAGVELADAGWDFTPIRTVRATPVVR